MRTCAVSAMFCYIIMLWQTVSFPLWINEVVLYLVVAVVFTNHTNSRPVTRALTLLGAVFTKQGRISVALFGLKVVSQKRKCCTALILNTPI